MNKSQMLLGLKHKDNDALNYFIDEYSESILRVINSVMKEEYLKDFIFECYNDTLLTVWKNAGEINDDLNFDSYIKTIARNKAIDCLRKLMNLNKYEYASEEFNSSIISAEDCYFSKVNCSEIINKINILDESNKKILIYRFFLEKEVSEIGFLLGLKETTVYKRIERIKKKIGI